MKHEAFIKALKSLRGQYTNKKPHTTDYYAGERNTQESYCTCRDSNGEPKYLYTSQDEIEYMLSSKKVKLRAYPCPYEKGWHLTKI